MLGPPPRQINLLPPELREPELDPRKLRRQAAIVLAVAAVVLLFGGIWWQTRSALAELGRVQEETTRLQAGVTKGKKLEDETKAILARAQKLEELAGQRESWGRLLEAIGEALPEGTWLTALTAEGGNLKLTGYAPDLERVGGFMYRLSKVKGLSPVALVSVARGAPAAADSARGGVGELARFEIQAGLAGFRAAAPAQETKAPVKGQETAKAGAKTVAPAK